MVSEILIAAAVAMAVELLAGAVRKLRDLWGRRKLTQNAQAVMSDTDKAKIEETRQLIRECFGDSTAECIREKSNRERIAIMADFAERLVRVYDLNIDVDVTVSDVNDRGFYDWKNRKALFNIALLMIDGDNEYFAFAVDLIIETIIHELRHAVQHHTVENKGFWNVDEDRRQSWAENMLPGKYIRPEVDERGYASQPIEKDAVTFAELVMEGIRSI